MTVFLDPVDRLPMGHPGRLVRRQFDRPVPAVTRQDPAIVLCGGGDPLAELALAHQMCTEAGLKPTLIAGNDQIACYPDAIDHAATLHPEKLHTVWLAQRTANGYAPPGHVWTHRPFPGTNSWILDWSGSTGLFCAKIARRLGFVHVMLCGVPMTVSGDHFIRKEPWKAADGFRRGWNQRLPMLTPYVRSFAGWTREKLGEPTMEWLTSEIEDRHPVTDQGPKA